MIYVGGKFHQAPEIKRQILHLRQGRRTYVEPFLGGGYVAAQVARHFDSVILGDAHEDLMMMWKALQQGWTPPYFISKEDYQLLAAAAPSALRGWAGFAASYRSKWFGGWAGSVQSIDHIANNTFSLLRKIRALQGAHFRCSHYRYYHIDERMVVYCDPPYSETLGYAGVVDFDSREFWRTMDSWVSTGALVLVSEFTAPPHWKTIKRFPRRISMDHRSSSHRSDRLFLSMHHQRL